MTSLVNKTKVKQYVIDLAKETRGGKFTRVSPSFIERAEAKFRAFLNAEVHSHPSVGKTLK